MKKFLLILFVVLFAVTAMMSSCQKDPGSSNPSISATNLNAVNAQLKGTWLFPYATVTVVDGTGAVLAPNSYQAAPAFIFDGTSNVTIINGLTSQVNGTYTLTTTAGGIFLNMVDPNNGPIQYLVTSLDGQTLKLISTQTTSFTGNNTTVPATNEITTTLSKQTAADVSGNIARVTVRSDSLFSAIVYVSYSIPGTNRTAPPKVLDNVSNLSNIYNYEFSAASGDYILIGVTGSLASTYIYGYYNGLPIGGTVVKGPGNSIQTGSGWYIPTVTVK